MNNRFKIKFKKGTFMKLTLALLSIVLASQAPTYAQESTPSTTPFTYGFQANLNSSSYSTQPSTPVNRKLGLSLGGQVELRLSDLFFFQPELRYSQKGYSMELNGITVDARVGYLELPLLLKLKAPSGPSTKAYFVVGPNFGIKVGSSGSITINNTTTQADLNVKSTDIAFDLGAGVEIPFSSDTSGFIGARYSLGLTNVTQDNTDWKSQVIQAQLGIHFLP